MSVVVRGAVARLGSGLFLALTCLSCASFVDLPPRAKGGVENPVLVSLPEGERAYLRRLRGPDQKPAEFRYLDAILGPTGVVLDRYRLENPAWSAPGRSWWDRFKDSLVREPEVPVAFRIYMNMYHQGEPDRLAPPGFTYEPLKEWEPKAGEKKSTVDGTTTATPKAKTNIPSAQSKE